MMKVFKQAHSHTDIQESHTDIVFKPTRTNTQGSGGPNVSFACTCLGSVSLVAATSQRCARPATKIFEHLLVKWVST